MLAPVITLPQIEEKPTLRAMILRHGVANPCYDLLWPRAGRSPQIWGDHREELEAYGNVAVRHGATRLTTVDGKSPPRRQKAPLSWMVAPPLHPRFAARCGKPPVRGGAVLSEGIRVMRIPFGRGGAQDGVCIKLDTDEKGCPIKVDTLGGRQGGCRQGCPLNIHPSPQSAASIARAFHGVRRNHQHDGSKNSASCIVIVCRGGQTCLATFEWPTTRKLLSKRR
jgi:hypothetical protein